MFFFLRGLIKTDNSSPRVCWLIFILVPPPGRRRSRLFDGGGGENSVRVANEKEEKLGRLPKRKGCFVFCFYFQIEVHERWEIKKRIKDCKRKEERFFSLFLLSDTGP